MRLVFLDSAYADLERIEEWIKDDRPGSAEPVIEHILKSALRLTIFPLMGRKGHRPNTLEWVVPHLPYVILYVVNEVQDELQVIAIFHARQNREWDIV